MGDVYKKSKGNAGLDGVQFQLDLLTVCLLNALYHQKNWKISSENQAAGKYDDLVLELPDRNVYLQAKFKQNKKINRDQLLSTNSKNADFSLSKYFFSYLEIKSEGKEKTFVICTNTDINQKTLENVVICQKVDSNGMLHYKGATCPYFTLTKSIVPDLKASAKIYLDKNLQDKGFNEAAITEENIEDFLENLQFFYNYPSGEELHKIIDQSLSRLGGLWCKTSYSEIYRKVEDWFKQPKGEYLTEIRATAMICEIRSEKYCESLKDYNISFARNDLSVSDSNRIIYVKVEGGYLLQILKIFHALQDNKTKQLYVNPDDDIEVQKQVIEAFERRRYGFLIIIWSTIKNKTAKTQIGDKLRAILEKDQYKKVILVGERNYKFSQQIGLEDIAQIDGSVTFEDLSEDSQNRLLKTKNIDFQGKTICLEELIVTPTEDYSKLLHSGMLETLIGESKVKVGTPPLDLDEETARCYVHRRFERDVDKKIRREGDFPEECIFDVNEKVMLISSSAGMGKSTVLTKLAVVMKETNPHLWVIKITLNDYTKHLKEVLRKAKKTVSVLELLNSQEATKLTSQFERFVFSMKDKVVFMLDGVDEISPDYTGLILSLISLCLEAPNFAKIIVTTRTHIVQELRAVLRGGLFKMVPFTLQNQIDFLTNYWAYNLGLDDETDVEKCEQYADTLITKMSSWIKSYEYMENHVTAVPLQIKMLAEIFQENIRWEEAVDWEGCKEYLTGNGTEPKLPEKFNIARMYDMFIEKKRNVVMDKGNPSGNTVANQALIGQFEECLAYHRCIALEVILSRSEREFFSNCHLGDRNLEDYALKIGIVQKFSDDFHFVHRTFAEYFIAKNIVRELEHRNPNVEFQRFLVDEILLRPEFEMVRAFFDNFLQKIGDSLPPNIFENYESSYETDLSSSRWNKNIIFVLSKEGCLSILQLILKSVDFEIVRGKKVNIADWGVPERKKQSNTLSDLRIIMRHAGINLRDRNGNTPLHFATESGHLETVKFLIEYGANVNIRGREGQTALHLVAAWGALDIVKYLVEHGADANIGDDTGRTALHLATESFELDTVEYLIKHGVNVNVEDNYGRTVLHWAVQWGELNTVKHLVELGVDVNAFDNNERTPLLLAVERGKLDCVRYLVEHGGNVHEWDGDRCTLLHRAVECFEMDIVNYLMEHHVDVNFRNSTGQTAFHLAVIRGVTDIAKRLVELGADVDVKDNNGCTALHYAVQWDKLETVRYLVELGSDVNLRTDNGRTVVHLAAESFKMDTARYFVEHGVDVNIKDRDGSTVLHSTALRGELDTVKSFVQLGANVNIRDKHDRTPLLLAAREGKLYTVKYLLEQGADVNLSDAVGHTALHVAALTPGALDVLKYFLECDIDINMAVNCRTVLHLVAEGGESDVARFLLERGADLHVKDKNGREAVHLAAKMDKLDTVKNLIEWRCDINVKDRYGRTPLHLAAKEGRVAVVDYLLARGVDVNVKDVDGRVALHLAAKKGRLNVVKYLIELDANIDVRDSYGRSLLHLSVKESQSGVIRYLFTCGVDVNAIDCDGRTALHLAAKSGKLSSAKHLIDRSVNLNAGDNFGLTALHIAIKENEVDIVKYLVMHGANINARDSKGGTALHFAVKGGEIRIVKYLVEHSADVSLKDDNGYTALCLATQKRRFSIFKYLRKSGTAVRSDRRNRHVHFMISAPN